MTSRRLRVVSALVLLLVPLATAGPNVFPERTVGRASLHVRGTIPVVHLYGTPDEMGTQYGTLLDGAIGRILREVGAPFLASLGGASAADRLRLETKPMQEKVPASAMAEMKAAARAAGVPEADYILFNLMFDVTHGGHRIGGCTTVAATGVASASGEPILGRNFDVAGQFHAIVPLGLIVVRHPASGIAWAAVTHPAFSGTHAGLNERGLAAGATAGQPGRGYDLHGTSSMMLFRRVLEEASTAAEAQALLEDARVTVATTLMVMDARGETFVAELAPGRVAFRRPEKSVLYETNHFVSKELHEDVACTRFAWLDENVRGRRGFDERGMKEVLASIGQPTTIQSMIFFPVRLGMAVASGTVPATQGRYVSLTRDDLFPAAGAAPRH